MTNTNEALWKLRGNCHGLNDDTMFPVYHGGAARLNEQKDREALAFCVNCPVIEQCRAYVDEHRIPDGVWAGETEQQRAKRWRKRARDRIREMENASRRERARLKREAERETINHGTVPGIRWHKRHKEALCLDCELCELQQKELRRAYEQGKRALA